MSFQPLYRYIDRDSLAHKVRNQTSHPDQKELTIVDVRDDDFAGGNIVGATNHPSSSFNDTIDDIIAGPLRKSKQVVFHCHLSQQRGPKAAGQYAKARQEALESGKLPKDAEKEQEVLVLRGGFSEFQDKYKADAKVIEKYDAESWQFRN